MCWGLKKPGILSVGRQTGSSPTTFHTLRIESEGQVTGVLALDSAVEASKCYANGQLQDAWTSGVLNFAEIRIADVCHWRFELRIVQQVEKVCTKFGADPFRDWRHFGQREIDIKTAGTSEIVSRQASIGAQNGIRNHLRVRWKHVRPWGTGDSLIQVETLRIREARRVKIVVARVTVEGTQLVRIADRWISNQIGNTGMLTGLVQTSNTTAYPFNPNPDLGVVALMSWPFRVGRRRPRPTPRRCFRKYSRLCKATMVRSQVRKAPGRPLCWKSGNF